MTLTDFVTQYNGKGWDFDGYYGDQCMDLFEFYNRDVVGAPTVSGNAIDVPNTYPHDFYSWTANTPTGIPQAGDIIIWGQYSGVTGQYGHIAIFLTGDANNFTSLDQNFPTGSLTHEQTHNYDGVLGWLHPLKTTDNTYKGIDLSNTDSVKVCVDIWYAVTQGQYVPLDEVNAICTTLGIPTGSSKDAIIAAITKLQKDKADDESSLANLNKQIPDLEGQISTLNNQVTDLQQKLTLAQNAATHPDSGINYMDLYNQAESDIADLKKQLAASQEQYNRAMGQYQNTSALLISKRQLALILLQRFLKLS